MRLKSTDFLDLEEVTRDKISLSGGPLQATEFEIGFIHKSVKDYLVRPDIALDESSKFFRINKGGANLEISLRCIEFLNSRDDIEDLCKGAFNDYGTRTSKEPPGGAANLGSIHLYFKSS